MKQINEIDCIYLRNLDSLDCSLTTSSNHHKSLSKNIIAVHISVNCMHPSIDWLKYTRRSLHCKHIGCNSCWCNQNKCQQLAAKYMLICSCYGRQRGTNVLNYFFSRTCTYTVRILSVVETVSQTSITFVAQIAQLRL